MTDELKSEPWAQVEHKNDPLGQVLRSPDGEAITVTSSHVLLVPHTSLPVEGPEVSLAGGGQYYRSDTQWPHEIAVDFVNFVLTHSTW